MRRKDREVFDINEIYDILIRCDTVRIGIHGEQYPYVVPVSFGAEMADGRPVIYFHCARQGMKLDLLNANAYVCVDPWERLLKREHGQALSSLQE